MIIDRCLQKFYGNEAERFLLTEAFAKKLDKYFDYFSIYEKKAGDDNHNIAKGW